VSIVSQNSYAGTVGFALTSTSSSLNTYGCYTISNTAVTAGGTSTASLTIYTSESACSGLSGAKSLSRKSTAQAVSSRGNGPLGRSIPLGAAALAGALLFGFRRSRKAWAVLSCLVLVGMLGFALGCGSSNGTSTSTSSTGSTSNDVAQGTYTLTLTGTDTSTSTITASTTLTLTVN
jgi:hypothetical protein